MTDSQNDVSSIRDIVQTAIAHPFWLFRGHKRASLAETPVPMVFREKYWPSSDGKVQGEGTERVPRCGLEAYIAHEFRDYAHAVHANCPNENQHFEWLALMQHHGVPTRLLDWTRNILAAAYFAVEPAAEPTRAGKGEPSDASIWALNVSALTEESRLAHDKTLGKQPPLCECGFCRIEQDERGGSPKSWSVGRAALKLAEQAISDERSWGEKCCRIEQCCRFPLAVAPPRTFPRLVSQASWFTIHPRPSEKTLALEDIACMYKRARGKELMIQFRIPGGSKKDILHELAVLGVTQASLFPDLDGLARSLIPELYRRFPKYYLHRQEFENEAN